MYLRKSPVRLFLKRLSILCLVSSLIATYLYLIGNWQSFLDETQKFLLLSMRWMSLSSLAVALIGFLFGMFLFWKDPLPKRLLGFLGYAGAAAASGIVILLSFFIEAMVR
jgi:hypothetical protein